MSLNSIFICFMILFFLIFLLFCIPIRVQFLIAHQNQWSVTGTIKILFWQFALHHTDKTWMKKAEQMLKPSIQEQIEMQHTIKVAWKSSASFVRELFAILAKRLHLENLHIRCEIGWDRADYTAYSYGLFWAFVAFLPQQWLQQSEIYYLPNFQQKQQDIEIQGIIRCTIGNFIGIIFAWVRLMVIWMLEQNRKEQMTNENGLRR